MSCDVSISRPGALPLQTRATLSLIGFTATVAQVVLLRELLVVSYGNEMSLGMMLASWLLWTAFGSGVLGRAGRDWNPVPFLAALLAIVAAVLPATILLIRNSRRIFHALPGELMGPVPIFLICLATLCFFCTLSGWAFVVGSRLYAQCAGSPTDAVSSVYLLEAAGSALGGIFASVILLRWLGSLEIAAVVGLLNLTAAVGLLFHSRLLRRGAFTAILLLSAPVIFTARIVDTGATKLFWPGFHLLDSRNSVYGNLSVLENGGTRTLVQNGVVMFSAPDPANAEESVHFALLEHPAPRRILLIGGGGGGALREALKHSTLERVDYVELDPAVLDITREYFAEPSSDPASDSRVHLHAVDGRLFLKTTAESFDVIVVNLPSPQSAQINRFYTLEFFRAAASKLEPDGVFSFQLHAAEEYLSPDLSAFLRCIHKTLGLAFPVVDFIPGDPVHFFAAKHEGVLAADSKELLARLRARHLATTYVREYFIPYRLAADRIADLRQSLAPAADTPVNRDLSPIAYYFDVALWSTQFNREYQKWFAAAARIRFRWFTLATAVLLLAISGAMMARRSHVVRMRGSAMLCVGLAGFTSITLEVLLLLGFQSIYGYIYHHLAIVIGLFMSGMALGSWWGRRTDMQVAPMRLAQVQIAGAFAPLLMFGFLYSVGSTSSLWTLGLVSWLAFPMIAAAAGAIGGYEFAVATQVFFAGTKTQAGMGTLYGIDLAGACLGALILSAFLLPIFGFFQAALLTAVANLVPGLLALWAARTTDAPRAIRLS